MDVGIEQADAGAKTGQREGQIDRHRRLAHTTLAARNADESADVLQGRRCLGAHERGRTAHARLDVAPIDPIRIE